jgi:transcriptional regulator with XRE-family HTH domain
MKLKKEAFYTLMNVHNLSESQLAEKIGISRIHFWRILNGKSRVGTSTISGFVRAFPNEQIENFFEI